MCEGGSVESNLKGVGFLPVIDEISMIKPYLEKEPEPKTKSKRKIFNISRLHMLHAKRILRILV